MGESTGTTRRAYSNSASTRNDLPHPLQAEGWSTADNPVADDRSAPTAEWPTAGYVLPRLEPWLDDSVGTVFESVGSIYTSGAGGGCSWPIVFAPMSPEAARDCEHEIYDARDIFERLIAEPFASEYANQRLVVAYRALKAWEMEKRQET